MSLFILTQASTECLIELAKTIATGRLKSKKTALVISKDQIKIISYGNNNNNAATVLLQLANDDSFKPEELLIALPYLHDDDCKSIKKSLKILIRKGCSSITWFGQELGSSNAGSTKSRLKELVDQVNKGSQKKVTFINLEAYGPDEPKAADNFADDPRLAYADYCLALNFMAHGDPPANLAEILTELVRCHDSNNFTLPLMPGEEGGKNGRLSVADTKKIVDRFLGNKRPAIAGHSPAIRAVKGEINKIAMLDLPVLIQGETGTGKELAAYYLHELSPRRRNNFVTMNCAGLDDQFLESTLFGHVKGAFTDAKSVKEGLVQEAACGTLFLDEVPELSPRVQAKLLRFLQSGEYYQLGSNQPAQATCRVIAGGQPGLIRDKLREDLYYRLAVAEITLPPLREIKDDILTIARNRADALRGNPCVIADEDSGGQGPTRFRRDVVKREAVKRFWDTLKANEGGLKDYNWPGNTRELFTAIKKSMLLAHPWAEIIAAKPEPKTEAPANQQGTLTASASPPPARFNSTLALSTLGNQGITLTFTTLPKLQELQAHYLKQLVKSYNMGLSQIVGLSICSRNTASRYLNFSQAQTQRRGKGKKAGPDVPQMEGVAPPAAATKRK